MAEGRARLDVSVVIAAYNVEGYIRRAVDSALAQEGVAVEVIVVDDGSVDGTATAAEVPDERVRVLRTPGNLGPSAARNLAIGQARAPWVAILDGDDVLLPGRLSRLIELATASGADIVVDNLEVRRESDGAAYPMYAAEDFGASRVLGLRYFIERNSQFLGGKTMSLGYVKPLISRDFLSRNKLLYDPELRIGEDFMLLADALALGARCVTDLSAGYGYTVRAGSISHRMTGAEAQRIAAGDRRFEQRHDLDAPARRSLARRTAGLRQALAFSEFVEALQQRRFWAAFLMVLRRPVLIWRLRWAIFGRLGGLFKERHYG